MAALGVALPVSVARSPARPVYSRRVVSGPGPHGRFDRRRLLHVAGRELLPIWSRSSSAFALSTGLQRPHAICSCDPPQMFREVGLDERERHARGL